MKPKRKQTELEAVLEVKHALNKAYFRAHKRTCKLLGITRLCVLPYPEVT